MIRIIAARIVRASEIVDRLLQLGRAVREAEDRIYDEAIRQRPVHAVRGEPDVRVWPKDATPEMQADVKWLQSEGIHFSWPLESQDMFAEARFLSTEPKGQMQLADEGGPIGPEKLGAPCEECGGVAEEGAGGRFLCEECSVECAECHERVPKEEAVEAVGEDGAESTLCEDCAEDLEKCESCEKLILENTGRRVGGDQYCDSCSEDAYWCEDCENNFWAEDMNTVDDKSVCDDCFRSGYFTCEGCKENFPDGSGQEIDSETYCIDCASENFSSCENCGEMVPNDEVNATDDGVYCNDCYEGSEGARLHQDVDDLGVDFEREIDKKETPLADRLRTILKLMGDGDKLPIAKLRKSRPGLIDALSADMDINRLREGGSLARAKVEVALDSAEPKFEGLRVSLGEWKGDQRMFDEDNLVFRLDAADAAEELERQGDKDAATLLRAAGEATGSEHPGIPGSTIGWARVVQFAGGPDADSTWYIEELQSDFDGKAGTIKGKLKDKETATSESTSIAGLGLSDEQLRQAWARVGDLIGNWELHLLAKIAQIAKENGVERLAILSKGQLDKWTRCPQCGQDRPQPEMLGSGLQRRKTVARGH